MTNLLSTKDAAKLLNVNEKMIYTLVSDKGLPATKVTGKWLFPRHLIEQWIEAHTVNYPESGSRPPCAEGLLVIAGSNDPLLDKTIALYNTLNPSRVAVFGNLGSMGGLRALRQGQCHAATSHLLQENENDYNFDVAVRELDKIPAVINFCRREQGLLIAKSNPMNIKCVADLAQPAVRIANRPLGTGTRLLLDYELKNAGITGEKINGYTCEFNRHLDVGLEILAGRADAAPGIRAVAGLLDLEFLPLRWERYDLMVAKDCFFDENVQRFIGMLHDRAFHELGAGMSGYDLNLSGKMLYPQEG